MSRQGSANDFDLEDAEWDLHNTPRTTASGGNETLASVDRWEAHSDYYFEQIPEDMFNNPISLLEWLNAHPSFLDHWEERSANRNESLGNAKRSSESHNSKTQMISPRNRHASFYSAPASPANISKQADSSRQYTRTESSWQERPHYNRKILGKKIKSALVDQIGYDNPCYISRAGTIIRKARIDWRDYRYSRFLDMLVDFGVDNGGFICFGPCKDGKHTHQKIWVVR